ncbi:MAG: hypothetical protein JOS17DRAFT_470475 [Linnemannia elongata]|nr:MAG: hypothetical protein JOS17DRAFT_470475 [Linnemannia elongata]
MTCKTSTTNNQQSDPDLLLSFVCNNNSTTSQGHGLDNDSEIDSDSGSNASSAGLVGHQTYPWSNYSLPQLRDLLRQRGQLTTGSKSALKKRLKNLDRAAKLSATGTGTTITTVVGTTGGASGITGAAIVGATLSRQPAGETAVHNTSNTTIHISSQQQQQRAPTSTNRDDHSSSSKDKNSIGDSNGTGKKAHPLRSRMPSRSNSFSAHFSGTPCLHLGEQPVGVPCCSLVVYGVKPPIDLTHIFFPVSLFTLSYSRSRLLPSTFPTFSSFPHLIIHSLLIPSPSPSLSLLLSHTHSPFIYTKPPRLPCPSSSSSS